MQNSAQISFINKCSQLIQATVVPLNAFHYLQKMNFLILLLMFMFVCYDTIHKETTFWMVHYDSSTKQKTQGFLQLFA